MKDLLLVGLGGFAGSIARYAAYLAVRSTGGVFSFPVATFSVNLIGAFLIGVVVSALSGNQNFSAYYYLCAVGFCGGFTTFSTFSLDALNLMRDGNWSMAILYITASVVLCVAGTWLGLLAGGRAAN